MLREQLTNGKDHRPMENVEGSIAATIANNPTLTSMSALKAVDKTLDLVEESLSERAAKQLVRDIDFSKPLQWDTPEKALQYLQALTAYPPLHSVVINIGWEACAALLQLVNRKNRNLRPSWRAYIQRELEQKHWVLNGATVIFSKSSVMLDGQHRMEAAVDAKLPLYTHVVFGMPDENFSRIDQGHKKTGGDILKAAGVEYENEIAAAIRWVMWYEADAVRTYEQSIPHEILRQARGRMKDIDEWITSGHHVNAAYKYAPSMVTALLYMIARRDRATAENFVHSWLHGNRTGVARNFDVLSARTMAVKRQNGGNLNREIAFALLVQTFNHWNAGVVAAPNGLYWKKGLLFPKLEFDAAVFRKNRDKNRMSDTTLKAQQLRVLDVLVSAIQGDDARVSLSQREIADKCNIDTSHVGDIIRSLIADRKLTLLKRGAPSRPAVYKITAFDE